MAVIINGMNKPTCCSECDLCELHDEYKRGVGQIGRCKRLDIEIDENGYNEVLGSCPIVKEVDDYIKPKALVIAAYPGMGKSFYYKEWSQYSPENVWRRRNNGDQVYNNVGFPCGEKITDSDSSFFSWIWENGVKTNKRNPDFPNNYIEYIKDHLYTEDIIFVSTHQQVRDALKNAGIDYVLIYPDKNLKFHLLERYADRGNDESFIKIQFENFDKFIDQLDEESFPHKVKIDERFNFIDNNLIRNIREDLNQIKDVEVG